MFSFVSFPFKTFLSSHKRDLFQKYFPIKFFQQKFYQLKKFHLENLLTIVIRFLSSPNSDSLTNRLQILSLSTNFLALLFLKYLLIR